MARISFKVTNNSIGASLRRVEKDLTDLPKLAHQEFVKNTPVRTGNAKRKTRLSNNTIRAQYDYASDLDKGRSRQAPRGMIEPTLKFIKRYLKRIIRK